MQEAVTGGSYRRQSQEAVAGGSCRRQLKQEEVEAGFFRGSDRRQLQEVVTGAVVMIVGNGFAVLVRIVNRF